jgi:N-acetylgalactosamine kinase
LAFVAQDTVVALAPTTTGRLRVANVNGGKYPTVTFGVDPGQAVDRDNHVWANYFLCGFKGVHDYLAAHPEAKATARTITGLDVIIDGRVPTGSGLSSSSALVCASVLGVMTVAGLQLNQADIAELACVCERYSGTQSGGMDQAISIMGQRGLAKARAPPHHSPCC